MLLIFSIANPSSYAQDVVLIEKNTPAPYTGFLFPEDKARQIRKDLLELDYTKLVNESLTRSQLDLELKAQKKDQQINILLDQNQKYLEQNKWTELEKIGVFILGIATMYGASKLK